MYLKITDRFTSLPATERDDLIWKYRCRISEEAYTSIVYGFDFRVVVVRTSQESSHEEETAQRHVARQVPVPLRLVRPSCCGHRSWLLLTCGSGRTCSMLLEVREARPIYNY